MSRNESRQHFSIISNNVSHFCDLKPKVESPDSGETGAKILSIRLCVAPLWKTLVRYLLNLCTAFILSLLAWWMPSLRVLLTVTDSTLTHATQVVVYAADRNIVITPLLTEKTSTKTLKAFNYRLFKYYYDENENVFRPCQFMIQKLTYNQIHERHGRGADEKMVQDHKILYGKNITKIPEKSCLRLIVEEVLSPFYVFQVFSFTVWYYDEYVSYGIIIIVCSVVSIIITLHATFRIINKLKKMSFYEIDVIVYRKIEGEPKKMTVSSGELVPGDLIEIPEGAVMPCDAILLNGSCIMNESMLTGESIPVVKNALPYNDIYYKPDEDRQYTLYAGTKCIQTRYYQENAVLGVVTLTGFSTVKGDLIRTMLFPKPSDFKFYADAFKFLSILAFIAFIGFLIDLPSWLEYNGESSVLEIVIIKASELITVTVPPALPTCIQIGITVAINRLRRKKIFCISPNKINEAGRVNIMCFDKTGTLTEEGLDMLGVRPVFYDKNLMRLNFTKLIQDPKNLALDIPEDMREKELINYIVLEESTARKTTLYSKTKMFPSEQMLEIMATCHSLTIVDEKLIGDPLDLRMFKSTKWTFEENDKEKYDALVLAVIKPPQTQTEIGDSNTSFLSSCLKEIGLIRRFEFSSKLQRMSVVVKNLEESGFKVHIKGAPEKIRELCKPETIPENFHYMLEKYTEHGYRVIACATKPIKLNYMKIMTAERENIEKDFTFVGFIVMENRLKQVTNEIIDMLHKAEIKTIMVTGDHALTAISVARQCQIVGNNQRIFLGDLAEKKINDKDVIVWKDFEFSEWKLNNELVPDLEFGSKVFDYANEAEKERSPTLQRVSSNIGPSFATDNQSQPYASGVRENLLSPSKQRLSNFPLERKITIYPDRKGPTSMTNAVDVSAPFYNMREYDDYCIAVTGRAFSLILEEVEEKKNPQYVDMLHRLLKKCVIFARMQPDEKALMIKYLKSSDPENIVGMCGDGANDVVALKTAHVGISLSEAEASIAAPFTSSTQNISCVPRLLTEGRAALSTSYQEFKFISLYSIIQFVGVTMLYYHLIDFTTWAYYHMDVFIVLLLSGTMALTRPYNVLTTQLPPGRLLSVRILTSVIGQIFIQGSFQMLTYKLLTIQPWYDPEECEDNFDSSDACSENTSLYLVSVFQYCIVALVFMVGKPFKKPFYTNIWFTSSWGLLMVCNFLLLFNPFGWRFLFDQDKWAAEFDFPDNSWRSLLLLVIWINSLVTVLWELVIVKHISNYWKNRRDKKKALEEQSVLGSYQPPSSPARLN